MWILVDAKCTWKSKLTFFGRPPFPVLRPVLLRWARSCQSDVKHSLHTIQHKGEGSGTDWHIYRHLQLFGTTILHWSLIFTKINWFLSGQVFSLFLILSGTLSRPSHSPECFPWKNLDTRTQKWTNPNITSLVTGTMIYISLNASCTHTHMWLTDYKKYLQLREHISLTTINPCSNGFVLAEDHWPSVAPLQPRSCMNISERRTDLCIKNTYSTWVIATLHLSIHAISIFYQYMQYLYFINTCNIYIRNAKKQRVNTVYAMGFASSILQITD